MDVAYDAVQKEAYPDDDPSKQPTSTPASTSNEQATSPSVSSEFREAYKDFSSSSWGATFGGWWNTAKQQSQVYYEAAQKELNSASTASRGAADLTGNTGAIAISKPELDEVAQKEPERPQTAKRDVPENLGADIVKEAGSLLSGFQFMAGERLKKVQAAEDAADEALARFGSNLKNYLQDAVKITAPDGKDGSVKSVLFESKDQEGRRVVHATRFDAQLHVIHANPDSFMTDPDSPEYAPWKSGFDVEKKTDSIAADLAKYDELRRSMEKLVPDKVEYVAFCTRYYFLRHVLEEQEQKRRELLKGADEQEEVKWDDDDEDDEQRAPSTPKVEAKDAAGAETPKRPNNEKADDSSKTSEGRRSNEGNSVADSDTSYDMVSGATSRGPGSPKEDKEKKAAAEQSDDEDWE